MKGAITAMKNIDYDGYLGPRMTRDVQRRRLQHVLDNELTELQRRAVIGYYLEKKTSAPSGGCGAAFDTERRDAPAFDSAVKKAPLTGRVRGRVDRGI